MNLDDIVYRRQTSGVKMGAERVNQLTGGILHMTSSDRLMSLAEIISDAEKYNEQFKGEMDHVDFDTDPFVVAQSLALLSSVGLVRIDYRPFMRADIDSMLEREKKWSLKYSEDMFLGEKEYPCLICSTPTRWVSLFFETALCSLECAEEFDEGWLEAYNRGEDLS